MVLMVGRDTFRGSDERHAGARRRAAGGPARAGRVACGRTGKAFSLADAGPVVRRQPPGTWATRSVATTTMASDSTTSDPTVRRTSASVALLGRTTRSRAATMRRL